MSKEIYNIIIKSVKLWIYKDEEDKEFLMESIMSIYKELDFKIIAYCFMSNHLHIIIEAQRCVITKFLRKLNASFKNYYIKKHDVTGKLIRRTIVKQLHNKYDILREIVYIHKNPVKENICQKSDLYE